MNKVNYVVITVLCSFGIHACSAITHSDKPVGKTWWLNAYSPPEITQLGKEPTTLSLTVTVAPGLDSPWIMTLGENAQLNHYAGARWADNTADVIESLLSRSFSSTGNFRLMNQGHRSDCAVSIEVLEFFSRVDAAGHASEISLNMDGNIDCRSSGVSPLQSKVTVAVSGQALSEIVATFQRATDKATMDLLLQIEKATMKE